MKPHRFVSPDGKSYMSGRDFALRSGREDEGKPRHKSERAFERLARTFNKDAGGT
jgi:hypothetical protein